MADGVVGSSVDYVAPRTEAEKTLVTLWQAVLEVEQVGIHDNFFELGGHSLLATRLTSQIRSQLEVEVPLRVLFAGPTVADLAYNLNELDTANSAPPITPTENREAIPLSFAQQRLWFLDQLEGPNAIYNVPMAVRLTGTLDLALFERAINEIVARHEVLRTTFGIDVNAAAGEPVQQIHDQIHIPLQMQDFSQLGGKDQEAAQEAALEAAIVSGSEAPFDLANGPLLTVHLFQTAADDAVLLIVMHHIISDGWSVNIFWEELAILYGAYISNVESPLEPPLEPLTVQYADFAIWQRNWLSGEVLERELGYWREKLAGLPELLELPTDHPRPPIQSFSGRTDHFMLTPTLTSKLHELSQHTGSTLFMTLLAAYAALLSRYSRQDDIAVGTPIANRNRAEIEPLIGFFVNTLVMRTHLSEDLTFAQLLEQVQETALDAYAHQDLPFDQVVEAVDPVRSMSHTPLFQHMFTLETLSAAEEAGTEVTPEAENEEGGDTSDSPFDLEVDMAQGADYTIAKFDLTLGVAETTDGLACSWEYNTDLFESATIERMNRHFEQLLLSITDAPDAPLATLSLLDDIERDEIVVGWNETARDYPTTATVHELFEAQAQTDGDAIAIVDGETVLTYAELNSQANQLAHHLRTLGVSLEEPVGICVERSPRLVVGMLAILKAGGVYVPLDTSYPAERLAFMLQDTSTQVVISEQSLLEVLPEDISQLLLLDDETCLQSCDQQSSANLSNDATGENLAYIIYTSGSTGRPKGVMVPHQAVNRLVINTDYVDFSQVRAIGQASNASFDAATFEVWGALLNGAKLVIIDKETALSPEGLANQIAEDAIDTLFLTTALFNQIAAAHPTAFATMRYMLFGGEAVDPNAVARIVSLGKPEHLLHVYGPTESTTYATWHEVEAVESDVVTIPIGRPIANTTAYILDSELNPVPVGVPGELYIGGDGLARGYWQREELTAERFVQVGMSSSGQVKKPDNVQAAIVLYKTGDLVRWNADGAIEFMGRLDHQVKLRGFRIELGEIESYLSQHEQVQESMVLALDDPQGNKRLIGYIVTTTDQSTNNQDELADALRSHLRSHLPDYMVPSGFVLLDEMPLTPNGKVDRKALTGLADEALGSSVEYVAPRTAEEEALVALWQEVLQSEPIGIHDNFFELGGHSLLATQLISHIRSELEIELPLRALFEGPTVAELAIALTVGTRVLSAPPIVQVAERKNLPLSFAQQRLWFLDQLEGPSATYNVPLAVDVDGGMDTQAFERAINYVVARHEALRTTFTTLDGEPVQTIHDTLHVPLHVESFDHFKPADREEAITEALSAISQQPFDLAVGPLLRVHLLQIEVDHGLLIIVMHHIISDGWSLNLFMEEVGVLYELFSSDEDQGLAKATEDEIEYEMNERLPELPVQYADFAVWQRNWLQGEVLDEALGYWRNQLAGAPELLELPTDRPRPAIQTFQGNVLNFTLEADVALGLQALGSQTGSTLFMTLLAAYSTLLSKYSRQDDIAIGTPIANRNRVEIEPLIGFFVNTLVMRTDLSENPTFEDLLAQVKQRALDAYKYQDVPFEQVVDALDPVRSMSYPPLFQHFFVLQNASSLEDESDSRGEGEREEAQTDQNQDSGFALTEGVAHTIAKFDTTLSISEGTNGELICAWEYNTDLFDEATIRRMVSHFGQLLRSIIAQPKERISTLTMLESAEQGQLLAAGQQRARFAVNHTLHGRFEQQAIAGPNQIAVTYESQSITYDQLNRRANQVAHRLVQLGVTTESHVGLCVERSIDMVVGVLAILKAGGAYVPLDPASPATRLAYILKDAGISVLLTQEGASESLPQDETLQRLFLDDESLGQESDENLTRTVTTEDLAYIIYTSGSTGQPKGVMVEHQQVARLFTATESLYSFNEQDVWTLFHSIAFDFSVWELWGALLYGGRLVVVPYWISRSPDAFYDLLIREQVTVLNQTPSAFNSLQAADQADYEGYRVELNGSLTNGQHQNGYNQNGQHQNSTYSNGSQRTNVSADKLSLRWIIFGGEALALENLRGWFERHGDNSPQLVNMYGITETTVHVTYRIITRADVDAGRGSLIGQPISDLSLYILDAAMNPVPVGVAGELYVGGAGVARGYHNRLELNKERFVRDCFADNEGRLYRSGDLARRLPDGDIEYLGRIDQQVKIRGFRIELGEIESALLDYHYVAEASVLALDDGQGMSRLVAYVIPQLDGQAEEHDKERTQETHSEIEDSEIDEATAVSMLRSHLREQLPEYMIPSSFVFLEEMPLTNNGKLDRRILATMADNVVGSAAEYVAPRTPIEEQFAAIWQEVLQVERVGIYDNFFELGGHSLAAVKLIALIEKEISMKLPLTALFSAPTVASLAETIQEGALTMPSQNDTQDGYSAVALSHAQKVRDLAASQETEWSPLVSIQPHGSRTPLFCVHPSGGTVFCYVPLSQVLGTDQPLYGLQSVGQTGDRSAFEQMETIAAMYLDAIRTVQPSGPYQLIGYSSGGTIAYEMAQQLRTQGEEVSFLGLLDTQIPAATEAPQWLLSYDEVTDQELVYNYLFEQWSAILNPRGMRKLEALSDKGDRLAALITQLQDAGIMPEEVDMYNVVDGIRKEFGYGPAFTSSDDDLLEFLFEEVGDELGKEVIKAVKKLATPSEQLAILIEKADQEELLPVQGGIEALSDYYMMTNTVARSIARYQPQPFDRAITFFKADEQVGDGIFWLAKWWWLRKFKAAGLLNGSDHGWDKLAQGGLDIQTVPGNHFTVLEKPHVNKLAEQIEHTVGNVKESELNNLCIRSLNPSR
ncbi:MAG: amino acid adenylation domain-containing protein [Chloroflexota bacterium]